MKLESLDQLFEEELRDIYDAEKQLVKALPKMAKSASSEELREAFTEHLEVTKGHVGRLEQVFESIGVKPRAKACAGMKGLVEEGQETIDESAAERMKDLALIGAAQRVEHYQIAAYGTARTFAEKLGNTAAAELLDQTLNEEKEADQKLTEISETLLENAGQGLENAGQGQSTKSRASGETARAAGSSKSGQSHPEGKTSTMHSSHK